MPCQLTGNYQLARTGVALPASLSVRVRDLGNRKPRRTPPPAGRPTGAPRVRPLIDTALLHRFENHLQQHALSPATIRNYLADLRAFSRWQGARRANVSTLSPADFRAYREHLCHETDHSPATVNRRLQSLRLFGRFLEEVGRVAENPTRDLTLLHNRANGSTTPRTLTRAETERLLAALCAARPSLAARDSAIVQLMLGAGLRVQEVAALRLQDAQLTGRPARVEVRAHPPRAVPLSSVVARALRDYLAVRPALARVECLFVSQRGQPLSVRSIQRLVDTYARAAGLRDVSAQSLRHTCARNWLAETHDAARVAGWLGYRDKRALEKYSR